MADTPIAFVSRGAAKASLHHAKNRLRGLGMAETGEFSIASFEEEAARIVVQERCMLAIPTSFGKRRSCSRHWSTPMPAQTFRSTPALPTSPTGWRRTGAATLRLSLRSPCGNLQLSLPRLRMSEEDLSRACTAMEIRGHRETPRFLVDKPLDVRMYTPELVALYTCSLRRSPR